MFRNTQMHLNHKNGGRNNTCNEEADIDKYLNEEAKKIKYEKQDDRELWNIFRIYEYWERIQKSQFLFPRHHKILYVLLERLFWSSCSDMHLISAIIQKIYVTENHFHGIIYFTDFCIESATSNSGILSLEFFLKHSYKKRMLFSGKRMASLSAFFSGHVSYNKQLLQRCYSKLPDIIWTLLNYGAILHPTTGRGPSSHADLFTESFDNKYNRKQFSTFVEPNDVDFFDLCNNCISEIYSINPNFLPLEQLPSDKKEALELIIEIANLMIRDSPQFQLGGLLKFPYNEHTENDITNFIWKLSQFLPNFPYRCLEPMSLKHMCRQIIRKSLHLNWELPQGIFKLPIPKKLTHYLNLKLD